jgi:hypothetical protein
MPLVFSNNKEEQWLAVRYRNNNEGVLPGFPAVQKQVTTGLAMRATASNETTMLSLSTLLAPSNLIDRAITGSISTGSMLTQDC